MHGIIHVELKKYVIDRLGPEAWGTLLKEAGLQGRTYAPTQAYPDADAVALVTTAARITGKDAGAILEDFGFFVTPALMQLYKSHVNPAWHTLDMVENTEAVIHRIVRSRDPGAAPPELRVTRHAPDKATLHYASGRHMCGVAKGIVRGLAEHYKENVDIEETACMLKGAPRCDIVMTVRR